MNPRGMNLPRYPDDQLPTVSGGKDNPPDRYIAVPITGDFLAEINAKANEDYRIAVAIPGYVLMGNYKENK